MKTHVLLSFCFCILTFTAQSKPTQWSFECTAGPSWSTENADGVKMRSGGGLEGTFHYQFSDHWGGYAGWGWNQFSVKHSYAGANSDFEETGYVMGVQFKKRLRNSPCSIYLRSGASWKHIEIENEAGDLIKDSKHGWGYQVGGGLYYAFARTWSLSTGVTYHALERNRMDLSGISRDLCQKYISLRIGIAKTF